MMPGSKIPASEKMINYPEQAIWRFIHNHGDLWSDDNTGFFFIVEIMSQIHYSTLDFSTFLRKYISSWLFSLDTNVSFTILFV